MWCDDNEKKLLNSFKACLNEHRFLYLHKTSFLFYSKFKQWENWREADEVTFYRRMHSIKAYLLHIAALMWISYCMTTDGTHTSTFTFLLTHCIALLHNLNHLRHHSSAILRGLVVAPWSTPLCMLHTDGNGIVSLQVHFNTTTAQIQPLPLHKAIMHFLFIPKCKNVQFVKTVPNQKSSHPFPSKFLLPCVCSWIKYRKPNDAITRWRCMKSRIILPLPS